MTPENPHSYWPTPIEPILPLLPHLKDRSQFFEPCAGNGDLVHGLEVFGHELLAGWDIDPRNRRFAKCDAQSALNCAELADFLNYCHESGKDPLFITNPPFSRKDTKFLKTIIPLWADIAPTWLLMPAGFKYNDWGKEFMQYCVKVVAIGRVIWIEGAKKFSTKDYAWYLFDRDFCGQTQFFTNNGGLNVQ